MKEFNQLIKERDESMADMVDLADNIRDLLEKKFPNGNIKVETGRGLTESISVWVGLIGNTRELTSGIAGNDPLGAGFIIFRDPKGFVAESRRSNLKVNPAEGVNLVMDSVKIPFRKVRGDESRVLKAFERWADRAISVIKDEQENVYNRSNYSDKYFRF